ncbi:MAG: hypothetical protein ACP5KN_03120 [Armatimonadota bacterium]
MNVWERMLELDRRWVFLGIAVAVIIPIVTAYALPLGKPAPPTVAVYDYVEEMAPGEVVLVSIDYSPSSMPELHPQARAVIRHCLQRDLRVITMSLNPQGTALARDLLATVAAEVGAEEGVDCVNLGFKPGVSQVILGLGESIPTVYPTTADGRPIDEVPVMEGVETYDDVALLIDFAAGNLPFSWIAMA